METLWTACGWAVDGRPRPAGVPRAGQVGVASGAPPSRGRGTTTPMRSLRLLALTSILALSGCAALNQLAASAFEKPKLTFRSATLQSLDLEGATLGFQFDLENPNGFGLTLARLGYGVEVEGTRIAAGDMPGGLKIPAAGKAPVTFPVRVRYRDVPGIVSLLGRQQESIRYKLGGTVGVSTPVGVVDLPISHEDSLKLPRLPAFTLEGLSVRSVSLSDLALDVKVRVKNPNAFAIPSGTIDSAVSLAGSQVGRIDGRALAAVPAQGSTVLTIPLKVDLVRAGRAASELMRGAPVDVGMHGTADLGGLPVPLDLGGRVPVAK